ncbi:ABC1 family-domain-containing protein [Infundibulicybe gibba]|nr:ABC1 family-domain-containing protein [Infundibulicybe gibba]
MFSVYQRLSYAGAPGFQLAQNLKRSHPKYIRTFKRPWHTHESVNKSGRNSWLIYSTSLFLFSGTCYIAYENSQGFRRAVLATVRCSRVAGAAILGVIDYKRTEDRVQATAQCHSRSANRVLKALLANGGTVFIKMGQHMASLADQCDPTPYKDLETLFLKDIGVPISDLFDDFDPNPIGVASLAQVHVGHHRQSGKRVAVKLQHPHLDEFLTLGWVKYWFPEFEFTWLGEEMRTNLPKEMDFVHEASNAKRAAQDFENIRTSLYIPEVISATKRVLIMEYIQGGRVDDLKYLADAHIDRNKVALELSRIFNQMVFVNGWFHAVRNLLIRPAPTTTGSPYNFEIVLLDHGLYFDMDAQLRVNYSKLWLALIAPASPSTNAERRKYAELVGNIGPDLYPVFEAAITGRAALEGTWETDDSDSDSSFKRASGMIDMLPQTEAEMQAIRDAVISREGLLLSVFDVLRRVPRRVLMVLKLNDLTRFVTNSTKVRIFLVTAKYCTYAVWCDERKRLVELMRDRGLFSMKILSEYFSCWWYVCKTSGETHLNLHIQQEV